MSVVGEALPDLQATTDRRGLRLERAGIRGVRYPLEWIGADGAVHSSIANWSLAVALAPDARGTHMSRFIELLERWSGPFHLQLLPQRLDRLCAHLDATEAELIVSSDYLVRKRAPVSGIESWLDVAVRLSAERKADGTHVLELGVEVPVTSLCPCSKTISRFGAHNQRSRVTVAVVAASLPAVEQLVACVEAAASCPVFTLLKRSDEKYVTEAAYENAKFAEDMARDTALRVLELPGIERYRVEVVNAESIHNHDAFAVLVG